MKTPKEFVGKWRITETEVWGRDALDLVVPAHLTIQANANGRFEMIAVVGEIDSRFDGNRMDFSWVGNDEMDEASGRGWAVIGRDGALKGRIYFHHGDESSFVARREENSVLGARRSTMKRPRAR